MWRRFPRCEKWHDDDCESDSERPICTFDEHGGTGSTTGKAWGRRVVTNQRDSMMHIGGGGGRKLPKEVDYYQHLQKGTSDGVLPSPSLMLEWLCNIDIIFNELRRHIYRRNNPQWRCPLLVSYHLFTLHIFRFVFEYYTRFYPLVIGYIFMDHDPIFNERIMRRVITLKVGSCIVAEWRIQMLFVLRF